MRVYADNAATTSLSDSAFSAYTYALKKVFGNASSVHTSGFEASCMLEDAREKISKLLGASNGKIIFTSGGSESNNTALLSAALRGVACGKRHIVSSAIEHASVLETLRHLEASGFEVTYIKPQHNGITDVDAFCDALRKDTAIATLMYANNEIGTIQPVSECAEICHRQGIVFLCDAVQATGHIKLDISNLGVDMLSLSAHKFHGPKGVGALFVREISLLEPLIHGGEQEFSKRAGTENVPAIYATAVALETALDQREQKNKRILAMREHITEEILKIPGTVLNGDSAKRLAGNANFSFEGVGGEQLLYLLDTYGVEASSGSACAARNPEASHVLLSLGASYEQARSSLRITLDEYNTDAEVEHIVSTVKKAVNVIRKTTI